MLASGAAFTEGYIYTLHDHLHDVLYIIACFLVIEMTYNLDIRRKWDKNFSVIELVEEKPGYNIVYW